MLVIEITFVCKPVVCLVRILYKSFFFHFRIKG